MTQSPRKTSKRKSLSASFVARVGLMAALALIFSYVEAIIPYNPGVPGIKLGIANVVTVVALYKYGAKDALAVSVIRVVLAGCLGDRHLASAYDDNVVVVILRGRSVSGIRRWSGRGILLRRRHNNSAVLR